MLPHDLASHMNEDVFGDPPSPISVSFYGVNRALHSNDKVPNNLLGICYTEHRIISTVPTFLFAAHALRGLFYTMQGKRADCCRQTDKSDHPAMRVRIGQRASIIGIMCNVFLSVLKVILGIVTGSISIIADGINNISDASSNIIAWVGFRLAEKPADAGHPYGHGRYEYVAGLVVALLTMAFGLELLKESIDKLLHPTPTSFGPVVVISLFISIAVKVWMMFFYQHIENVLSSRTFEAAAADSRNDAVTTSAVLAAAALSHIVGFNLDGWAGIAVAGFIMASGVFVVHDTIDPLLGRAPDPEFIDHIQRRICSYPGVLATHDLMVHDYGPGRRFASAHVEMPAEANPLDTHGVLDRIEQDFLREEGLSIILHYDPIVTDTTKRDDLHNRIAFLARSVDPRITIHDVHQSFDDSGEHIAFDCTRPQDLPLDDEELKAELVHVLRRIAPHAHFTVTIDDGFLSRG